MSCSARLLGLCLLLDEFKSFMKRLPSNHFLTIGSIHQHWGNDWDLQNRYKLLQSATEAQRQKIQRTARKLFGLSVRCRHNPNHQLPRERWVLAHAPLPQAQTWEGGRRRVEDGLGTPGLAWSRTAVSRASPLLTLGDWVSYLFPKIPWTFSISVVWPSSLRKEINNSPDHCVTLFWLLKCVI